MILHVSVHYGPECLHHLVIHRYTHSASLPKPCPPLLPCSQVTTTAAKAGGFEARFYHKIYAEEFGNVRGHFGPINSVAFSPDGRSFTTGGEDGYVRLHHFDMDYFTTRFF